MSGCLAVAPTREYSTELSYDLVAVNPVVQQGFIGLPGNEYERLFRGKPLQYH